MKELDSYIQEKFEINKNTHIVNSQSKSLKEFKDKYGNGNFVSIKDLRDTLNCSKQIENIIIDKYLSILNGDYKFLSSNTSKDSNLLYLIDDSDAFTDFLDRTHALRIIFKYKDHISSSSLILNFLHTTEHSCFIYEIHNNSQLVYIIQEYGSKLKK